MKIPKFPPQESLPGWADPAIQGSLWPGKAVRAPVVKRRATRFSYCYLKRLLDILLSILAVCFVLSWLLPLLCLLILIDMGAPVFFIQKRIGRYNRPFRCIKLRTIRKPDPGGRHQVTPLGQWLRNHKLDEIPQFFNVLKGEMGIVGPRPHMLSDHRAFSWIMGEEYTLRHAVLPGITGLAQVSGYEGPVASPQKLRARVRLDLFYIDHWSMGLEFRIMYQTARLFIQGMVKGLRHQLGKRMPKNEK